MTTARRNHDIRRVFGCEIAPTSEESLLASLLDELTEALRQGQQPDVEQVAGRHPALADDLRSLWATVWVAEEMARNAIRRTRSQRGARRRCPEQPTGRRRPSRAPPMVPPSHPGLAATVRGRFGRLRAFRGAGARRHGGRLAGAGDRARPDRGAQAARCAGRHRRRRTSSGSGSRRRRRRGWHTPTSCRSSRSASATGSRTSPCNTSREPPWRGSWPTARCRRRMRPGCWCRSAGRSTTPTTAASCTATSSRRTS